MILEVDNKGSVDICNSWTVGWRTCHVEVKMNFLRELKEQGLVKNVWKSGTEMVEDGQVKFFDIVKAQNVVESVECC